MRLYFHTSSLNFLHFMVNGAISPPSFYQKHGFNRRAFIQTKSDLLNGIVLYTKPQAVRLYNVDNNPDEYPLVVELNIPTDTLHKLSEDVYLCPKTIQLNLHTTIFYLPSEQAIKTMLESARIYSNVKYLNLCKLRVKYFMDNLGTDSFDLPDDIEYLEVNIQEVKRDQLYNAIKGVLYQYAITSRDKDMMHFKKSIEQLKPLLIHIAQNKVDLSVGDPVYTVILGYLCNNSMLYKKRFKDNDEALEFIDNLYGILSISPKLRKHHEEIKLLLNHFNTCSLNTEALDKVTNKTIKALWLLLTHYGELKELSKLQQEHLPTVNTILQTLRGAFLGFSALSKYEFNLLSIAQYDLVEETLEEIHKYLKFNTMGVSPRRKHKVACSLAV